jgi:hypothetical protein
MPVALLICLQDSMHFLSTPKENLLENQRLIPSEENPMKFGPDVLVIDVVEADGAWE